MGLLLAILYSIRTIRNILFHLAWWDKKEWRRDRMWVHLSQTAQGKLWMFGILSQVKWFFLLLYIISEMLLLRGATVYLDWLVYLLYGFEAVRNLLSIQSDMRPEGFRPKLILIFMGTIVLELVAVLLISFDYPWGLALLAGDKLLPIIIFIQVWALSIVQWFVKQAKIQMAREKMSAAKGLRIVGVTGSFGKTTVKDFTYQLLSKKYRTFKTQKSQNSDIGIAELILRTDLSAYEFFVCEMAAYKPGDIASSTSMLGTRIVTAIVTGINEQHQSLYRSIENTKKAKYELVEATDPEGHVIINALSAGAVEMGKRAESEERHVTYVTTKDLTKQLPRGTAPHVVLNATLAAEAALSVGMPKASVTRALTSLELPEKTMDEYKQGDVLIINDTFNANPEAVYAALRYIRRKRGKKVFVMQPLIELGRHADEVHEKIGKLAAQVCDYVILANENWYMPFMKGVGMVKNRQVQVSVRGTLPNIKKGVMLFEGKEAEVYIPKKQ